MKILELAARIFVSRDCSRPPFRERLKMGWEDTPREFYTGRPPPIPAFRTSPPNRSRWKAQHKAQIT